MLVLHHNLNRFLIKLVSFFTYGAQIRLLAPGFIPNYFDGSYDKLRHIAELDWDLLVIDEAHNVCPAEPGDLVFVLVSGGGSAIPVAVGQAYQRLIQGPVLEVYGMTETASVLTMSYPERPLRLGSVGHPLPYSRVRIVKIDGDSRYQGDCAPDEIGVVAMAGPGVFGGYVSDAHNRGAFVEPGWVNSGDLGRLDADGYLWITGRAKDLIIRGGHNIDPQAIEEVFYQHPAVALAALVSQPDAYAGEVPVAYVQLHQGAQAGEAELLAYASQHISERAAVPKARRASSCNSAS